MIRMVHLTKAYATKGSKKIVADQISATFPAKHSIGLLGRNGAGKSTLLRMIAGTIEADGGHIIRNGSISWPIGFAGSFHKDLTGSQNARFVARVYGVNTDYLIDFVERFSELGPHFNLPFRTYSSGMKSRLAFGVSMAIQFDTYLIDEVTSVGDAAFKKKCNEILADRLKTSGAIVVSHSMNTIRRLCSAGAVLENGKLKFFHSIDEAIEQHYENMKILPNNA